MKGIMMSNESCTGTPEPTQCSWFDQALSSGVDNSSNVEPDQNQNQNQSQEQDQNQEEKN